MNEREVHRFESIDSTMYEAVRLANKGCPHGTAVVAEEQTAGHGRHGRVWHSERNAGLYVSVVLRLAMQPADLPILTLALGLAVVDAIRAETGLDCDLRWPNDVLVQNKKCCGILAQLHGAAVVAGIGINVNHSRFPEDLESIATSLRLASINRIFDRDSLLQRLLTSIDDHCEILTHHGREAIIQAFTRASSYVYGRRVRLEDTGETGTTAGLDSAGFLILKKDDGRRITVLAGGVRPE
jgi:BirA family transcriptional regulator, biotin operon repressor / biotin---[acetyl-CoA-carboxylase] ligase